MKNHFHVPLDAFEIVNRLRLHMHILETVGGIEILDGFRVARRQRLAVAAVAQQHVGRLQHHVVAQLIGAEILVPL